MPRVKQRTPELREKVLHAAMNTLVAGGVSGFTTRRVASAARTSTPAVYELFGDKAGLVREMFFQAFRQLGDRFDQLAESDDPREDLIETVAALRGFVAEHPALGQLMFSRPFADFDPGQQDTAAGDKTREFIKGRVRRCVDAGVFAGDETDIAHVVLGLAQGLASQEAAGWLGSSQQSIERRWALAIGSLLTGLGAGRPPSDDGGNGPAPAS
jgi:AcrR family transcriptional regulator